MKEIKQITFSEILLIPSKRKFEGSSHSFYCLKDPINGSDGERLSTSVYVILFNCEEVSEIKPIIEMEIQNIERKIELSEDKKILQFNLDFLLNLKRFILDNSLHHDAPDDLLFIFSKTGAPRLKKENVIFISGVSSLVEE